MHVHFKVKQISYLGGQYIQYCTLKEKKFSAD
jgi:hypothetical protein